MKKYSMKRILMSLCIMISLTNISLCSETSILPLIFFMISHCFLEYTDSHITIQKTDKILAAVLVLFITCGNLEAWFERIWVMGNEKLNVPFNMVLVIIGTIGLYTLCVRGIGLYFVYAEKIHVSKGHGLSLKKVYLICSTILSVACIISFFTYYPGVLINDSFNQLAQVLGRRPYNNHHPIAHTMLIKAFISLGGLISQNLTLGVVLYTVFQNILTILILSLVITIVYKYLQNNWVIGVLLIYYILNPVYSMYAQFMSKDVIFALCGTMYVLLVWDVLADQSIKSRMYSIFSRVGICVSAVGFCLLRTNGILAFIIFLPFLIILFRKNKSLIICSVSALCISVVFLGPVYGNFVNGGPDMLESLSIPLQQVARTVVDGKISEEQQGAIDLIIPYEKIESVYQSDTVDPIKNLIRNEGNLAYLEQHKQDYLKMYAELGIQNIKHYFYAFVDQTKGYWYPDVKPYIWNTEMADNNLGIRQNSILPDGLAKLIDSLWKAVTYLPGLGILKSIGALTWLLLLQFGLCIRKGIKESMVFMIPVFANSLTLLCSAPLACSVRYAYVLFILFPFLFLIPFFKYKGTMLQ